MKRKISTALGLLLIVCLLFGCGTPIAIEESSAELTSNTPGITSAPIPNLTPEPSVTPMATPEFINSTVERVTDRIIEKDFKPWENPEIPLSLLGLSEDEVKADGRYTKSKDGSEIYKIELNSWDFVNVGTEKGKIKDITFFYIKDILLNDESTREFFEMIDTLSVKYGEPKIKLNDKIGYTMEELLEMEEADGSYSASLCWIQDDYLIIANHSPDWDFGFVHNFMRVNARD